MHKIINIFFYVMYLHICHVMHEGTHDYRYCDLPTHHPFQPSFLNQRQPPHTGTTYMNVHCILHTF